MTPLIEQHNRVYLTSFGLATVAFSIGYQFLIPRLAGGVGPSSPAAEFMIFLLSTSGFYSLFFLLPNWLYRRVFWKVVNPDLNLSGYWLLSNTYKTLERQPRDRRRTLPLPHSFNSVFRIRQTVFGLTITQGVSVPNEDFTVRNIQFTEDGRFSYVYDVVRAVDEDSPYPSRVTGLESAKVEKHDRFGRPSSMAGQFAHVATKDIALYTGRSIYTRISRKRYNALIDEILSAIHEKNVDVIPEVGTVPSEGGDSSRSCSRPGATDR